MIDPTRHERGAMDHAVAMAGEHIESLGRTDLMTWSPEEFASLIEVIVTAFTDRLRELGDDPARCRIHERELHGTARRPPGRQRLPVLPIMPGTKKPGQFKRGAWRDYPGWTKHGTRPTSEHELIVWSGWPDAGIGIPTGTVIGVDIDIRDAELASRLEQLAREMLGDTPAVRFGMPPKRLLVYRTNEPLSGMKAHPIEVLGLGQQFVAFADHPETRRPYEWPRNRRPICRPKPAAGRRAMIRAFLDQAQALVPPELRPGRLPGGPQRGRKSSPPVICAARPRRSPTRRFIPNADLDYDSWVRIGMALKGALGEDGWDLFAAWSATSSKDVPETTAKTWASLKPERIGAGTIYHHALPAAGSGPGAGAERRHPGQRPASGARCSS